MNPYSAYQEKRPRDHIQFSYDTDFPLTLAERGAIRGGAHPPIMVTSVPALIGGQTGNSNIVIVTVGRLAIVI